MRKLVLISLLAVACLAQMPKRNNTYTVSYADTPAASATVLTIQQPAASANDAEVIWASIYCSVDCVVELERDGTAATTTAATEVGTSVNSPTPTGTAFSASNVGNGTTVDTFTVIAAQPQAINLTAYGLALKGSGTTKNVTLRTDSITGTVRMTICWREW